MHAPAPLTSLALAGTSICSLLKPCCLASASTGDGTGTALLPRPLGLPGWLTTMHTCMCQQEVHARKMWLWSHLMYRWVRHGHIKHCWQHSKAASWVLVTDADVVHFVPNLVLKLLVLVDDAYALCCKNLCQTQQVCMWKESDGCSTHHATV